MKKTILCTVIAGLCCIGTYAQDIAVKTNLLQWAGTTPNVGLEFGLGKKWSLEITGRYNPWMFDKDKNKKIRHWGVMPEARYWLCEKFNGHFIGLHSGYSYFNMSGVRIPFEGKSTKNQRYEGWATGAGISYGYSWLIGTRWNIELSLGLGYVYAKYDKYECETCGEFKGEYKKHLFRPTKAAVSFIYILK